VRYPWLEHGKNFHCQWSTLFRNPRRFAKFGDRCSLGNRCLVLAEIETGDDVMIASHVGLVSRNDHIYDVVGQTIRASGTGPAERIVIDSDVWIGHGSTLIAPLRIGRGSVIAAGSIVARDVPPYAVVGGAPARLVKYRFTPEQIQEHESALISQGKMVEAQRTQPNRPV
jgi:acetyltransferase-like isoleucine patch superfamily enzyme